MNRSKKIKSSKTKSKTRQQLVDDFSKALALADTAEARASQARAAVAEAEAEVERSLEEAVRIGEALEQRIRTRKARNDLIVRKLDDVDDDFDDDNFLDDNKLDDDGVDDDDDDFEDEDDEDLDDYEGPIT